MQGFEEYKITRPQTAIVHFKFDEHLESMGKRIVYYQVTLLPEDDVEYYSSSKQYVYFGGVRGDQITGWQPVADIVIDEVLREYAQDEVIPYLSRVEIEKIPDNQLMQEQAA